MSDLKLTTIALHFSHEDKAREVLEKMRWPDGPVCPHCGSVEAYRLTPKEGSKSPARRGLLKCKGCRKQFTVTVGTIFEGSHIPLHKWLLAISLLCSSKKGMSAHQLHRMLGITYKSAWFMAHRIRYAMGQKPLAEKLSGTVEADETYVGGKTKGKRGRGAANKTPVFALVERVTAANLKGIIRENVKSDAKIVTDEFSSYKGLDKEFAAHDTVQHGAGEYVRGAVYTNTIEGYFSLLKRGIVGVYHHVSPQHLHRYLSEFNFRYNARKVFDSERTAMALKGFEGKRLFYRDSSPSAQTVVIEGAA